MLFKSDTKQARDEIDALDKKIDAHRAKGKQISADEKKEMNEAIKQRKELNDQLKENQNNTEKLIESVTQATAAYISFRAIKSGIVDAAAMNRQLTIQTDLWQQNASDVAAYGAAVKAAGGSAQAAYGWYQGLRSDNASKGMSTLPLAQVMDRIHNQVKNLSAANAALVFNQYGISDVGQQTLLRKSDADYDKTIEAEKKRTASTAEGAKASQEFGSAVDDLNTSMTQLWTTISTQVLPVITPLIRGLSDMVTTLANNKEGAMAFFAVATAAATGLAANSIKLLASITGLRSGMLALAEPLATVAGIILRLVSGLVGIGVLAYQDGAGLADVVNGTRKSWMGRQSQAFSKWVDRKIDPGHQGANSAGSGSAMNYLMQKYGLDRDHAAGIVANMMAESGGDPTRVGDNGQARGAFQWHPDRQAAIKAQFGTDVGSMTQQQSLDAMIWELKKRGQYDAFMNAQGAGNAGAFISGHYEVAAGRYGPAAEAVSRANAAMQLANSSPFNSGTGSSVSGGAGGGQTVNVDKVIINTGAKDPQEIERIAKQAFANAAREAHAQTNDAVQM